MRCSFAEAHDFLLLRQHRAFQSFVPVIVIATTQDRELAKSVLEQEGVEDIVAWPLHKNQLEESLREAMCLYQTRVTIAHRTQTLHKLHRLESFPPLENQPGSGISDYLPKQVPRVNQRTIQRMETNLKYLTDMLEDCERKARVRAVEHLDLLGRDGGR